MSKRKGDPGYAPGWCIHYRYNRDAKTPEENTCEAGVRYDSVQGGLKPTFTAQPCFLTDKGESKPNALPCEKLRRPTPEEIAVHEKWHEDRMADMVKVMKAIAPWRAEHKKKRIGGAQTIDCPACGGVQTLSMTIAAYNGHVHARCKTDGCVSWIE
ncbi:MAG: hypothetical protein KGL39_20100 [Patescibacteria group bacterium]|nr:hypothetical protein [Patescibacteria group bacterium]